MDKMVISYMYNYYARYGGVMYVNNNIIYFLLENVTYGNIAILTHLHVGDNVN